MKYFVERASGVSYFFVLNEDRMVLPFGVSGPFAKKREAKIAASKLRSRFPGCNLNVYGGWFAKPFRVGALIEARAEARDKLKIMLGA